jgi:cysteine-rich repeat protein
MEHGGIPMPFALQVQSPLLGSIQTIGYRNNVVIRDIAFDNGELFEELKGASHFDSIDFLLLPDASDITQAPFCEALTDGRYFGYLYTSRTSELERERAGQGALAYQFPGIFFTSAAQRADGTFISDFETMHNIVFVDACDVHGLRNSRTILITNDAPTIFTARGVEWCGDGEQQPGEECDDGDSLNTNACTNECTLAICGDTFVQPLGANNQQGGNDDEQCEDGNAADGDACLNACIDATCGDGVLFTGSEQCDPGGVCTIGGIPSATLCNSATTARTCFDLGGICTPEATPICTAQCSLNIASSSSASSVSSSASSSIASSASSSSSSSTTSSATSSSTSSSSGICGDGTVQPPEECDDANASNLDQCTNMCFFAECGDGYHQPNGADGIPETLDDEECDDGNTNNLDSCDNQCRLIGSPFGSSSSVASSASNSSSSSVASSAASSSSSSKGAGGGLAGGF